MQNISTNEQPKTQAQTTAASRADILEAVNAARIQLDALTAQMDAIGESVDTTTPPDTLPQNGICLHVMQEAVAAREKLNHAAQVFELAVRGFACDMYDITRGITPVRDVKAWELVLTEQKRQLTIQGESIGNAVDVMGKQALSLARLVTFALNETLPPAGNE